LRARALAEGFAIAEILAGRSLARDKESARKTLDCENAVPMNRRLQARGIARSAADFLIRAAAHPAPVGDFNDQTGFREAPAVLTLRPHSIFG